MLKKQDPDNPESKILEKVLEVKNMQMMHNVRQYKSDAQRKVHAQKNESGIMYKAGVKKYGEKGMKAIQSAAGKGASAEEIESSRPQDKYNKKKGVNYVCN